MSEKGSYPSRQFSDQELKLSSWLVVHRELIHKIGYGAFIALDILLITLLGMELFQYISTYQDTENAVHASSILEIDWPAVRVAIAPEPLHINTVDALTAGNFLDFVAHITNANINKVAEFEYRFIWPRGSTEWVASFILPGASKYLLALGQEASDTSRTQLEIQNVRWKSISIEDKERLALTRDGLVVISSIFIRNINEELTGTPISGAEFVVENRLPFDLQNIPFNILVTGPSGVQALNRVTVKRIDHKEQRVIRVRWFSFVSGGTVSAEPDINYLDDTHIAPRIEETVSDATN